jgi:bacteriophage HK97-gp10 putative tail-component
VIDATELRAAAKALRALDEAAAPALEKAERAIGPVVADNVRIAARRHRRTGALERSITVQVRGKGAATQVSVHAGGASAHLVAGGVKRHRIRALPGHALAFERAGSVTSFAAAVEHPGFKAHPFFAEGVEASAAQIDKITAQALDATAGELATRMRRR